ncbi:sacsin N-terminal ATP-binding-like domain-containing protein [Neomicrococcus lactis]|uniref:ATP-binding protein n=1 Tax=Neomicrococcus lactis TaxID=732241 RepID=A0A7W9DCA1_9MICC|nr:hypothetical protein [Neomicrococcus lactis]MBB5598956.1 hypothetical protein [Neomicrococcus lactis]
MSVSDWGGSESQLGIFVEDQSRQILAAYDAKPDLVREHSNIELAISQSGYGRKQLNELIQNAADAVDEFDGRIRMVLSGDSLYCANNGSPLTAEGYATLVSSHSSEKRDDQIGRFGLGFKSVVQISNSPKMYSRSGSVGWDRERSAEKLRSICPGLEAYPILRLGYTLDPIQDAATDSILAELMTWATTVVKLPLNQQSAWLSKAIEDFPHEFLLFSPSIASLEFDDRNAGNITTWTAQRTGANVVLTNGDVREEWRFFQHEHVVSPQAAIEAGSIAARETVKVSWAVPMEGTQRRTRGSFWNFFPTDHQTSLRGIVNAAFKMNEDRHSILSTMYNREILERALPTIVMGALPNLQSEKDPASFLDLLPARGRESLSWADATINEPIFKALSVASCLPDRNGQLRFISDLIIPPDLDEATRLESMWDEAVSKDRPWLHAAALKTKERKLMVRRLLALANKGRASVEEWLEEVTRSKEFSDIEKALKMAVEIDKHYEMHRAAMRRSRIVPMQDGTLQAPITTKVFLPIDDEDRGTNVVAYDFVHFGEAGRLLKQLDLQALDDRGKVDRIARKVSDDYSDPTIAESLWRTSRSIPMAEFISIINNRLDPTRLLARSKSGTWAPLSDLWFAGDLIPSNSIGDEHLVVDDLFHRQDREILRNLGVLSKLAEPTKVDSGPDYMAWKQSEAKRISEESKNSPVPVSEASLRFSPARATKGLHLLAGASRGTRSRVTQILLGLEHFKATVESSSQFSKPTSLEGPDLWWIRNFGVLQTRLDLVDVKYCVGNVEDIPSGFLPNPGPENAEKLGLPTQFNQVNWSFVLPLAEERLQLGRIHELYAILASHGARRPVEILVENQVGEKSRQRSEFVSVTGDKETFNFLKNVMESPAIYLESTEAVDALRDMWKLPEVKAEFFDSIRSSQIEGKTEQTIEDLFPQLHLAESKVRRTYKCIPCSTLEAVRANSLNSHIETKVSEFLKEGSTFYYQSEIPTRKLLNYLLQAFESNKKAFDVEQAMKRIAKAQIQEAKNGKGKQQAAADKQKSLKTHASGFIPMDVERDLGEQLQLIKHAILSHLDTAEASVFDVRLSFEVDNSKGISEEIVAKVREHASRLGGQATFEG